MKSVNFNSVNKERYVVKLHTIRHGIANRKRLFLLLLLLLRVLSFVEANCMTCDMKLLVLSLKHAKKNETLLNTLSEGLFGDQYIILKT